MATALSLAIDLHGRPANWDVKVALYIDLLSDLPPDLLLRGMRAALRDVAYFPKPAEIREPIRDELSRRNDAARRLGLALMFAERTQR